MKKATGLSKEEIAAMKEYLQEKNAKTNGESAVLASIAKMPEPDRSLARRFHALVKSCAPNLVPRTWYGMPAYTKEDKVVFFFQNASKFKARYQTIGFTDKAKLDDGDMWPVVYAINKLNAAQEAKITALIKKAVG